MFATKVHDNAVMTYCEECNECTFSDNPSELQEWLNGHSESELRKQGHIVKFYGRNLVNYSYYR